MRCKSLIIAMMVIAASAFGSTPVDTNDVDITIGAKLVKPLSMELSKPTLEGGALKGTASQVKLTPIVVSFAGDPGALVKFSADQKVTLADGANTIDMVVDIAGSDSVESDGTHTTAELVLNTVGESSINLGGNIALAGTEEGNVYIGDLQIDVSYD